MATAATTMTTVLNRNSVTIWKNEKKRKRDEGIEEPVSYGTCGSSVSFVRVIATAKPQICARGATAGWVDAAAPLVVAPVFLARDPNAADHHSPRGRLPRGGARPLALGK